MVTPLAVLPPVVRCGDWSQSLSEGMELLVFAGEASRDAGRAIGGSFVEDSLRRFAGGGGEISRSID